MNSWPVGGEVDATYNGAVVGTVTLSRADTGEVVGTGVIREGGFVLPQGGFSIGPLDIPVAPTM